VAPKQPKRRVVSRGRLRLPRRDGGGVRCLRGGALRRPRLLVRRPVVGEVGRRLGIGGLRRDRREILRERRVVAGLELYEDRDPCRDAEGDDPQPQGVDALRARPPRGDGRLGWLGAHGGQLARRVQADAQHGVRVR
jgi:hypothetical protein